MSLTSLPRELLQKILGHLLRNRTRSDEHNAESWIDLLHACSSCKSFITDAGDGSLLEAVSEDMLARLLPSPYYRSAQPIARSAFGALSRSLSPCDLCYMGPTGRGQPCKRKYVSSALRAVDLHLKSVLTAANGAYLLQHRWLRHMGIGARESRLLRLRAGRREEAMRLRVLSDRTAGLAGRWWVSVVCLSSEMSTHDMSEAFAALCESHFILADYPQQMAIPLHRPLSYDLSYDPPHSDPPAAATRLGAAARLETAAPREARPRDRIVFETVREGSGAGSDEGSGEEGEGVGERFATTFVWLRAGAGGASAGAGGSAGRWAASPRGEGEGEVARAVLRYEGRGGVGGPCISSLELADGVEAGEAEAVAAALLAEVEGFAAHVFPAFGLLIRQTLRKVRGRRVSVREVSRPLFPEATDTPGHEVGEV